MTIWNPSQGNQKPDISFLFLCLPLDGGFSPFRLTNWHTHSLSVLPTCKSPSMPVWIPKDWLPCFTGQFLLYQNIIPNFSYTSWTVLLGILFPYPVEVPNKQRIHLYKYSIALFVPSMVWLTWPFQTDYSLAILVVKSLLLFFFCKQHPIQASQHKPKQP